jgi:hypothetical protein
LALKIIECDNICHSTPVFRGFLWHTHVYFQWQGFIYLLGALRTRTEGPEVDAAWQQVEQTYEHHPAFLTDTKRPLHVATGNLCLKAWEARESSVARQGMALLPSNTPTFVKTLRQQRAKHTAASAQAPVADVSSHTLTSGDLNHSELFPFDVNMSTDIGAEGMFDTTMLTDLSMEDINTINWDEWDSLVNGYGQLRDWSNLPAFSS